MANPKHTLTASEYRIFYEVLWHKIVELEHSSQNPDSMKDYSEQLFYKPKNGREFAFWLLEGSQTTDKKIFYRRYVEASEKDKIQLDLYLLYNCLAYMGYYLNSDNRLIKDLSKTELIRIKNEIPGKISDLLASFFEHQQFNLQKVQLNSSKQSTDQEKKDVAQTQELKGRPKQKAFENTNWFLFYSDEVITQESGEDKPTPKEGISWATLGCLELSVAKLSREVSPGEGKSSSDYTGTYAISEDSRNLQFHLKIKEERNLQIRCYIGDNDDNDICIGMATNVTEDFEAWAVVLVSQKNINSWPFEPGFSRSQTTKEGLPLPGYVWEFFTSQHNTHLIVPKTGTGVYNLRKALLREKRKPLSTVRHDTH